MRKFFKNNLFAILVVFFTVIVFVIMALITVKTQLIEKDFVYELSFLLKLIFISSYIVLLAVEYFKTNTFKNIISTRNLLIFSLITLLSFSIFRKDVGIYVTGFFTFSTLIYFIFNRSLYPINKVLYVIIFYAFFEMIGTIGTTKGFHFPEMSYSFYVLPLTFSLFNLEKTTLLRILKVFFRVMIVYVFLSLIFWFFNFEIHNVTLVEWITQKTVIKGLSVYDYVAKWGNYTHPSYISLVLLAALVSGFYLFYKNNKESRITFFELFIFVVGCIFLEFILESRVGILETMIIVFLSMLYYVKMRTGYFKIFVIISIVVGLSLSYVAENHFNGMMNDKVRKADYTLAINYIKTHPFWGSGYQEQRKALTQQDELMLDVTRPTDANAITYTHNQFLGNMVQYGIWGLLLLLTLLVVLYLYAIRSRSYLLQMLMIVYTIFMLIEEPLYVQEGITRFLIFLCFFIAVGEHDRASKKRKLL